MIIILLKLILQLLISPIIVVFSTLSSFSRNTSKWNDMKNWLFVNILHCNYCRLKNKFFGKMFIWYVVAAVTTILIWDYFSRDQRKVRLSKQFDGPLELPIIGNLYMYLDKKPEGQWLHNISIISTITREIGSRSILRFREVYFQSK